LIQPTNPPPIRHSSFQGRIGIARTDITPPEGVYARNWGAAKHDVASAIHRPLTLTAMTLAPLQSDDPTLIFVDTDLVGWRTAETFKNFFVRLRDALGVAAENVIFAVSHTHSAPP
jgi:hypothetical protein